jgi:hypothetical protein
MYDFGSAHSVNRHSSFHQYLKKALVSHSLLSMTRQIGLPKFLDNFGAMESIKSKVHQCLRIKKTLLHIGVFLTMMLHAHFYPAPTLHISIMRLPLENGYLDHLQVTVWTTNILVSCARASDIF